MGFTTVAPSRACSSEPAASGEAIKPVGSASDAPSCIRTNNYCRRVSFTAAAAAAIVARRGNKKAELARLRLYIVQATGGRCLERERGIFSSPFSVDVTLLDISEVSLPPPPPLRPSCVCCRVYDSVSPAQLERACNRHAADCRRGDEPRVSDYR